MTEIDYCEGCGFRIFDEDYDDGVRIDNNGKRWHQSCAEDSLNLADTGIEQQ